MQVLVRISPNILFSDRFRVKPYPLKQKKGVEHLPLKDLMRGPVCWAKMVHFWKPQKHAFWPSPECREPFSMLPTHTLSSFMVWNAGVGPWWAATAEIIKILCLWSAPSTDWFDVSAVDFLIRAQTTEVDKHIIVWTLLIYLIESSKTIATPNDSVAVDLKKSHFSQKGVQNRTLTPDPRTFTKMSTILLRTPLVSWWHQRGALEIHFLTGISTRPTWAPPATNWACRGA